jgi:hypothetical protein
VELRKAGTEVAFFGLNQMSGSISKKPLRQPTGFHLSAFFSGKAARRNFSVDLWNSFPFQFS